MALLTPLRGLIAKVTFPERLSLTTPLTIPSASLIAQFITISAIVLCLPVFALSPHNGGNNFIIYTYILNHDTVHLKNLIVYPKHIPVLFVSHALIKLEKNF